MKKSVIGILAHVDAGKTTLSEALLYNAGAIRQRGGVDTKNSTLDSHTLEKQRGITIFAGEANFKWGDTEITLLDTPGHVDFSAETERIVKVLDYAVLVISLNDGVQSHTRTLFKLLETYGVPTFIFVTKCDNNRMTCEEMLALLEKEFGNVISFDESMTDKEKLAMCDEALLDEFLEKGDISEKAVAVAIKSRKLFPCFFGSGLKNEGVKEFAQAVQKYLICRDYPSDFGALVYKISYDKNERLTKLKVTGGTLKVKDSINYSGISEKINQIRIYSGAKYITVDEVSAGTVCAVTGLTKTASGEGLGIEKQEKEAVLEPVMSYKIVLPDDCDPHIMLPKFKSLEEEDPLLKITYNERFSQFSCCLMGTVQAEIFKSMVSERFDTDIEITEGNVIYKETVTNTVEGVGHYEPLRHYAEVHLLIEPLERSSGLEFSSKCSENELDRNWQRLVLTHLAEKTHLGVLTGSPITDMKISLVSGKSHLKHTEGGDFRQATYRAVRQGLMQAKSILLEPYYNFRLELPSRNIGRAITDIKLMGGELSPVSNDGEITVLCGKAPVVTMDGYMVEVASYTGGLGRLSLELAGYDVCHNSDEIIKKYAYEPERDLDNTPDSVFCAHGAGFQVKWNEVKNYMHLESCFSKKGNCTVKHRHISIDEKELEEIMLKEFGPVKTNLYRTQRKESEQSTDKALIWGVKTKYLIIDGYNVIFDWDSLKTDADSDLDSARDKLCNILANYSHFTGCKIIAVFDGYKVKGNYGEKYDFHGVNVVFTKENETADAYIEKLIGEIGKNEQIRVVTSDGLIQLSAVRNGIFRMSSAEFEKEIDSVDFQISEIINKQNK